MRATLNQRLMLITTAGVLLTALAVLFFAYRLFDRVLRTRFEEKIALITRHLVSSAVVGLVFKDRIALRKLTEGVIREEEITAVVIEDAEGHVLVNLGRPGPRDHLLVREVLPALPPEGLVFSARRRLEPYGRVKVYYTTAPLEARLRALLWQSLAAALALALVVDLLLYLLVTRAVTRPLGELVRAVRRLEEGDFEFRPLRVSLPEVQTLSEAFAETVASLRESRRRLKESYEQAARNQTMAEIGRCALMIAHEVKNPLGIIKGSLDILRKPEVDQQTKSQMADYIEDEVRRMDHLIKSFLVFARPKKLRPETIALRALLEGVVERLGLQDRVDIEGPEVSAQVDPFWLEQVFGNLFRNALEAGARRVLCRLKAEDDRVVVEVEDDGPGVPDEKKAEIFKPFFTDKARGGTGLGLAIVEQIVSLHGGRVEVHDAPLGGALFRLELPKGSAIEKETEVGR